ncbi:activin receptor type-2A-like isoform X2 [Actinia tenebrosa]|uniref:Serine/threonine-protein kinase receptor n=1 Tax=Actinia tenebrosa TaxID=6105 RepID=A0A6P8HRT0_ACTTE|nr:activin receptor type-2A-like isoform X2 [Actinia tenebrosa]
MPLPPSSSGCNSRICESQGIPCHSDKCNDSLSCPPNNDHCFSLWENTTEGVRVIKKGCWRTNPEECINGGSCFGTPRQKGKTTVFFCCCTGDNCNRNFSLAPVSQWIVKTRKPSGNGFPTTSAVKTDLPTVKDPKKTGKRDNLKTLLYSIIPIFGSALLLAICLFMYHHQKQARFMHGLTEEEPLNVHQPPSPVLSMRPIQRLEVISQSQGGITVWKAKHCFESVAVKIFPEHEKTAWSNEKDFYTLCNLNHDNVLRFIAVEKHIEGIYTEYWLITEYHGYGSLSDYLKQHILSWTELCRLAKTMAAGLAYVHSEVKGKDGFFKPCIAHRDVKTKNILVKSDLSCCISDFGLALKFDEIEKPSETHGQVGTKRYMAPEVLEGAICFTREAFLRIDMYALGLVLWELATRCSAADGPVDEYRLPFEEEVGLHPSLEDMQQVVVQQRIRPKIREDWRNHRGLAGLVQTVEECWDQDGEARLTAQCVEQRIAQFVGYNSNQGFLDQVPTVTSVINNTSNTPPSRESSL